MSKTDETTAVCSNKDCPISAFHPSCLCITKIPKTWYCPNCGNFPDFNPKKAKVSKDDNKKQSFTQAMNSDHICTCSSKAEADDKLIKCHSVNCSHGTFFFIYHVWVTKNTQKMLELTELVRVVKLGFAVLKRVQQQMTLLMPILTSNIWRMKVYRFLMTMM